MLKKLFQEPLALFVMFGVIIFSLYTYLEKSTHVSVELSIDNRIMFVKQFELLTGRDASQVDIAKIEQDYIQKEILFREALAAGMHLTDSEVREKLIEEMRYQVTGTLPEPSEQNLVQYYLKYIKRYAVEPSLSFQHVFFEQSPDVALLKRLEAGEQIKGDEFWRGRILPNYGISMIRGMFGKPFLDRLKVAPQDIWFGPEQSMLGWHFVKVIDTKRGMPLTYEQAKMQVMNDYTVDILESAVDKFIADLDNKYQIIRHVE
ncbi:MAG: hypothetical protein ACI9UD_002488 [Glaciecola sp.]|jgi:hypothetical protein